MSDEQSHMSPRTIELLDAQPGILREGEPVKREARLALTMLKAMVDTLARTEIDLATLLTKPHQEETE